MEVLGRTSGKLGEYLQAKRERELVLMRQRLLMQKAVLLRGKFPALCSASLDEFHGAIDAARRAAEECDLLMATERSVPAVIMIPDELVSVRRKLELLEAGGVCDADKHKEKAHILEPYIAVNVMRTEMQRQGVKLAHYHADQGEGLGRPALTLGEVLMIAHYYPTYFEDSLTAVIRPDDPEGEIVVVSTGQRSGRTHFSVKEYLTGDLPDAKFQVITCEVRVGR